jgi:orotidine-5'-phosphate decarboxylase
VKERLIVALDVPTMAEADKLTDILAGEVGMFKIGKQLFTHMGPDAVRMVHKKGGEVFLDLKFHDIPTTVAKAAVEAARLGVKMLDLHASGSTGMMRRTMEEVKKVSRAEGHRRPLVLAVTVLTSLSQQDLISVGIQGGLEDQVVRLALLSKEAGVDGVVASALEAERIRQACGPRFTIVSAGIRFRQRVRREDQKRMITPREAIRIGVNYLVVGRPITEAKDPLLAAREIVNEMEKGTLPEQRHF